MVDETVTYVRTRNKLPIRAYTLGSKGKVFRMATADTDLNAIEGIDFLDTLKQLTTDPSVHLLSDLIQTKDATTNLASFDTSSLSPTDKNKVSKGYKQLESMNLVVRVKRGVFLINPRISPCYPEYFERVCLHWIQVTGGNP